MAIENELLALAFEALRFGFEMGVVLNDVFLVHLESMPKSRQRKSDSVSPYFHGGNPIALPQMHHST